eukprot:936597_1
MAASNSVDSLKSLKRNPQTLNRWIIESQRKHAPDATGNLSVLITSIEVSCKAISNDCNKAGIYNLYGLTNLENASHDQVKKLDVLSNDTMVNCLQFTGQVAIMASEEEETAIIVDPDHRGEYCVVFDPLDGSSNIDANVSVGTIWGIYRAKSAKEPCEADLLQKGTELVAAGYCMYGAATMMVLSTGHGINGFTLDNTMGEFVLTHPDIKIPNPGKPIYSVNEGNSANWNPAITEFVRRCHNPESGQKSRSLRYVGSMVADVHRTLLYGGIFLYPADAKSPNGKLRLVYEGNPMAFLIEQAGGLATTGRNRILDLQPQSIHERVPIILGSVEMVREVQELYQEMM